MSTTFSRGNYEDSHAAHMAARTQFYPLLFPGCELLFEDVTKTALDMDYAIDCKIAAANPQLGLRAALWFAVQERWRFDLAWVSAGDVTVTEWNLDTDIPSELHKLGAHLLVYGFYDRISGRVVCAAVIDVARLLLALALGTLPFKRRQRGDQSFLAFRIAALRECKAVITTMRLADENELLAIR